MSGSGRLHSMDALRGSAMVLVVPIHAAALLSQNGYPGAWATAVAWFVHFFRLPLFFSMSGLFAVLLVQRRGLRGTIGNRAVRLGIPLVFGMLTVVPLTILLAKLTGTVLVNGGKPPTGNPFTLEPDFLWFLWYLLLVNCGALVLYVYAPSPLVGVARLLRSCIAHPLAGILLLSFPAALTLWPAATWTAEVPATSFVPVFPTLLYYGLFFALGASLCMHEELIHDVSCNAWRWTACAVAATVPAALLFSLHDSSVHQDPAPHAACLLLYAAATWCTVVALIGLATRYVTRAWAPVRYVADASYWIYLSHMPGIVLLVAWSGAMALSTPVAFAVVCVGTLAIPLLTYPLLVRRTVIGTVLNGRAKPRRRLVSSRLALRGFLG